MNSLRPTSVLNAIAPVKTGVIESAHCSESDGSLIIHVRPDARSRHRCPRCSGRSPPVALLRSLSSGRRDSAGLPDIFVNGALHARGGGGGRIKIIRSGTMTGSTEVQNGLGAVGGSPAQDANRAERQFNALEPQNRLVARTVERRWEACFPALHEADQAFEADRSKRSLTLDAGQQRQILALASDLPGAWRADTTGVKDRKEMLGPLVKQIALCPIGVPRRQTRVHILWHTGVTTEVFCDRPAKEDALRTSDEVIAVVRELCTDQSDEAIAVVLNQNGLRTGHGKPFTEPARCHSSGRCRHHPQPPTPRPRSTNLKRTRAIFTTTDICDPTPAAIPPQRQTATKNRPMYGSHP
jgi:hypothetical protein